MLAIWRNVISSPLGTFSTYRSIVSSSERSPSAAAWRSRLTVKVLVTLPIRWCTSADIGSSEERSATPRVPTHVSSGVWTAAITPGAPVSKKDCSKAAFRASWDKRASSDACFSSACSSSWPPPPPQPLASRSVNAATKSPTNHNRRSPQLVVMCLPHRRAAHESDALYMSSIHYIHYLVGASN